MKVTSYPIRWEWLQGKREMKKYVSYIIAAVIASTALAIAREANAGCTTSNYGGNQTYVNCDDNYNGTASTYGNQTYYHDNRGNDCTSSTYGNQTYTNCY